MLMIKTDPTLKANLLNHHFQSVISKDTNLTSIVLDIQTDKTLSLQDILLNKNGIEKL